MNISGRTITKNASVLMVSQIITWTLTFLLTIFLPRYLGPDGLGQLQLAGSLWAIVAVIAALGTDTLITKEVAKSQKHLNELLGTTQFLRILIFIICALGMVGYIQLVNYSPQTEGVILIVGFASLLGQLAGTYEAALKGVERMEYVSIAAIISIAILTFLRIGFMLLGYGVYAIAAVGILSSSASLVVVLFILRRLYSYKFYLNWHLVQTVIKASLPYFLVSIGIVLYHQVDIVIISLLVDEKTIGWYGAAARLYGTLLFIPNVFVTALFPALSRAYADSLPAVQRLAQKSLNLLVLVSIPIGLGILVVANPLVILLFGASFAKSGPVLAVRGVLLILTYVNMLLGFLLISMDRQKIWGIIMLIATFATIPLDIILVSWTAKTLSNGALGGAISFAFTEIGMTLAGFRLLPRDIFNHENVKVTSKALVAASVMAIVTWFWRELFILVPVVVGAVTYISMIVILKAVPKEDWEFYTGTVSSYFLRIRSRFTRTIEVKG